MMINLKMNLIDDLEKPEKKAIRDGFGEGLLEVGRRIKEVVALCGDVTESMRVNLFKEEYEDRYFEMGVAEQNMMGVAAGMALEGKIPFVSSYAVFNPGRNWDQLRISVCYTKANVKVVGGHAGITVGADGASHQALEDLALTRVLPNLAVVIPADYEQAKKATMAVAYYQGPVYLRISRNKTSSFTTLGTPFEIGKNQVLREGKDLTIFGCGSLVYEALMVAEGLKKEADIEVVNVCTLKPLDEESILKSVKKTGRVVTVEEHQVAGGLGSVIAEVLGERRPVLMKRVGVEDKFGESGEAQELLNKYRLGREDIIGAVRSLLKNE